MNLLEPGIDPGSPETTSGSWLPRFEATVSHMEVSENTLSLRFQFLYDTSGPLVPQDSPTKPVFDGQQTFMLVLSQSPNHTYKVADNKRMSVVVTNFHLYLGDETYRFTGKPWSTNVQLYYNYQRWYETSTGRFISQDPVGGFVSDPQSQHPYTYVENIPTVLVDPAGLASYYPGPCIDSCSYQEGFDFETAAVVLLMSVEVHRYSILPSLAGRSESVFCTGCRTVREDSAASSVRDGTGSATKGVTPSIRGDLGVKKTTSKMAVGSFEEQVSVRSSRYGPGRIDVLEKPTGTYFEVKNQKYISRTEFNELQLRKYVDAVGAENLRYDLYTLRRPSASFLSLLSELGVKYRILPYIPYT